MSSDSESDDCKPAAVLKEMIDKKSRTKKRTQDQNKKRSLKKKKESQHEKDWTEYCKFMNANLLKKKIYHESPHLVIKRSFNLIADNSIIFKNPIITNDTSFNRNIFYEVDRVGKNVKMYSKNKKFRNVLLNETHGKKFFILLNLKYTKQMSGLIFFNELGKRMEPADVEKQEKSFILLGMVQKNSNLKKMLYE